MDKVEHFVVDNNDEEAVDAAVSKTKSVATVAGPYAKFGEPVVKSCVKHQTHYGDITGETSWVSRMIEGYHKEAAENGTFIVPCCGFDCIPSDLTALAMVKYLNQKVSEKHEQYTEDTERKVVLRGYITKQAQNNRHKGGPSGGGGTLATVFNAVEEGDFSKDNRRYNLLTSEDDESTADKGYISSSGIQREHRLKNRSYTTYFPLCEGNEKVVRRSRYLMPHIYGKDLSYRERRAVGSAFKAATLTAGLGIGLMLVNTSFTRGFVKKVVPQASQTPQPKKLDGTYKPGRLEFEAFGEAEYKFSEEVTEKVSCKATFIAPDEVAWTYTAILLAESCISMVKHAEEIKKESGLNGGILTPACLGTVLIDRLKENEVTLEVTDIA